MERAAAGEAAGTALVTSKSRREHFEAGEVVNLTRISHKSFDGRDVPHALVRAASPLVRDADCDTVFSHDCVETSLDTARTSACGTWAAPCEKSGLAALCRSGPAQPYSASLIALEAR